MSEAYEAAQEIKAALQQLTEEAAPTRRERIAGLVMAHLMSHPWSDEAHITQRAQRSVQAADALLAALDAAPTVPAPARVAGQHTLGSGV